MNTWNLSRALRVGGWLLAAAMLLGCGPLEEAPGEPVSSPGAAVEPSGQDGKNDTTALEVDAQDQGEVTYPFIVSEGVESEEEEPEEYESKMRCAQVCFKASWCSDGEVDLAGCMAECEVIEETGLLSEAVLSCMVDAQTCEALGQCESQVEICDEICGFYDYCGYFEEGAGCHGWCVQEMWVGRLGWEEVGCLDQAGRDADCQAMKGCGLSDVLQG
jgi:hypothetical protein